MASKRIPIEGGDWVDLVTRLNHAQFRRIRLAQGGDPGLDIQTETVAAMAATWSVRDVDGVEVPYPGGGPEGVPAAALDRFPSEVMVDLFTEAAAIISGGPSPNDSAARSGSSSTPEPRSE